MPWPIPWGGGAYCRALVPATSPHAPLYAALVCGADVPAGAVKSLFVDCGLIHILVVSGAHLGFVDRIVRGLPAWLRGTLLVLYCWATDWGAPVVRALVGRVVRPRAERRGASVLQAELLTTLATLALWPPWVTSRSFLMSWLCVLALAAPGRPRRWRALHESVRVWIMLWPYSLAAPLTIAWNCVAAPIIGRVTFPAALLALLCPPLVGVTDLLWDALIWMLEHGPRVARGPALIHLGWIWWVPWVTHGLLLWGEWAWRRAWAFS